MFGIGFPQFIQWLAGAQSPDQSNIEIATESGVVLTTETNDPLVTE